MTFDNSFQCIYLLDGRIFNLQGKQHFFGGLGPGLRQQLDIASRAALLLLPLVATLFVGLHQNFAPFLAFFQFTDNQQRVIAFQQG